MPHHSNRRAKAAPLAITFGKLQRTHAEKTCKLVCIVCHPALPAKVSHDERFGIPYGRRAFAEGSAQSRLALTRQVSRTVMDLLVQLCGGDGGAVLVGMMSQAFPSGANERLGKWR